MLLIGAINKIHGPETETEESISIITEAIGKGSDLNAAQRFNGRTPLHLAAEKGGLKVSKLLIAKGAQVETSDKHKKTPLHLAAEKGWDGIVKLLIDHNALIDAADDEQKTPLFLAVENTPSTSAAASTISWKPSKAQQSWVDVTCTLIHKGACVNTADEKKHYTPLHLAAKKGLTGVAQLLVAAGANVDAEDKHSKSPLDFSWAYDPTSSMTNQLLMVSGKIERILTIHLDAQRIEQLAALIAARDPDNEEDSKWLGIEKGDIG
jgi:ankyrin repeat protein